jgi:Fructose/tagatose bisphosphate aldolase
MPVVSTDKYAAIIDDAKAKGYALPAINVTSSQTVNAVLHGLTDAESDGILHVSTGDADYFSGHTDQRTGCLDLLPLLHYRPRSGRGLARIHVAVHTDQLPRRCPW